MARPSRREGNLPADATSFIGRRRELLEVRKKLGEARLVSLVGPGGVGKTRLATRAASELTRGFPDGAWLVQLAEIRDGMLVSNALMTALDLRDQAGAQPLELLLAYLKPKDLLLVVDNCEHLLETTAPVIAQILSGAPGVRILATSREPLSIAGEHVVPVPPLELPPANGDSPLVDLQRNEAVLLFRERAAAASGAFELRPENRAAVIEICRRLDGLPLAIELAAVRTRVLGLDEIRGRLSERFNLLTDGGRAALPRHQTLRTTIDWSYALLSEQERAVMRRLCVFAGRFSFVDVQSICVLGDFSHSSVLDLLGSLVEKSLVMKEEAKGQAAYRLHETMREYAALQLEDSAETSTIGNRFIEHYRSTTQEMIGEARYQLDSWLGWMDLEIDNIRAALGHCLSQRDAIRGLDLVTACGWYWITRATTEGARWIDSLLAVGSGNPWAQFWAYFQRGFLAVLKSDAAAAGTPLERAVAQARTMGEPDLLVQALTMASISCNLSGDSVNALKLLEEAVGLLDHVHDFPSRISVLQAQSLNGFFQGDITAVKTAAAEGIELSRKAGDLYSLEMMLLNLGGTALFAGDVEVAKTLYHEALGIARRIDDRVAQYALLDSLGCQAAATGQARLAAQLIGAAETVRTEAGASLIPILAPMIAQAEAAAVSALGQQKFDAEVEAGRHLSRDEAIRLALGESSGRKPAPSAPPPAENGQLAALGKREVEVARLLAEGLTNRQIGARLFISERTVDTHVRSILNKLGFDSRAQIAGWIASVDR